MSATETTTRAPRFNHVAMSMAADALDEQGRADIVRFYTDVFGFSEIPMLTENRKRLVLQAYSYEQFVFLIADDPPMQCPRLDHFGMSVGSMADLDDLLAKCKAFQATDDRVDIIDKHMDDYGPLKLHSFYVRYLLPMMVEVQFFEYAT